jgi:hypothetical protein
MGLLGRASRAPIAAGTHRGAELTSSVKGFLNIGYRPSKKGWMAHSQLIRRPLMARLLDRLPKVKLPQVNGTYNAGSKIVPIGDRDHAVMAD